MKFKHIFIKNNSNKLFIYFNNMTQVGFDDKFTYYKKLISLFADHDILFIKDIQISYYYLTIMDDVRDLITKLVTENKYERMVSYADSSGAIPLLNILPSFDIFKKAVIINGQIDLTEEVVNKYRNQVTLLTKFYLFDEKRIKNKIYKKEYLNPITRITDNTNYEITFYYNKMTSDKVYCEIIQEMNFNNIKLHYEELNMSHMNYIIYKILETNFLNDLKIYLNI